MTRSGYEGVVYDLDGTLVGLPVDWAGTREDAADVYREAGVDPDGRDLWGLLRDAPEYGVGQEVEEAIAKRERESATRAKRLTTADELDGQLPTAVCSLNCEAACRIALETHGLADRVQSVVGRDSLPVYKPDPRPLLEAIEAIGCHPAEVVFVGDSERDELTAQRAGVSFQYVYG